MEKVFDEVVYPEELTLKKMDHVIDILIFRVSMNGKGDKFHLGIKFLCDLDRLFVIEVCPHNFSIFSIFDLGIWERGLMRNMCLLGEVLPNFFFLEQI
jgi:hypothetical protein